MMRHTYDTSVFQENQSTLFQTVWLGLILSVWGFGCGSNPKTPNPKVNSQTQSVQKRLGPILGPVTKGKIIDRLAGYPVCGMKTEPQKQTLILRFHALGPTIEKSNHTVVEVECFF